MSLFESTRSKLINQFRQLKLKRSILVIDETSIQIINELIEPATLNDLNIVGIERLQLSRKQFQQLPAIYILSNNIRTIQLVVQDFESCQMYSQAHLMFLDQITKEQMNFIRQNKPLLKNIKSLKELNIDFVIVDNNSFRLQSEIINYMLKQTTNQMQRNKQCIDIGRQISTVIASLNKFYQINLYYLENENNICQDISYNLESRLRQMTSDFQKQNNPILDKSAPITNILIFDRTVDMNSMFVQDFYYQSLLHHYYQTGDKVVFQKKELSFRDDEVFEKMKYNHFGVVLQQLDQELQLFKQTNQAAQFKMNGKNSNMNQVINQLPQYQKTVNQYDLHLQIANSIMSDITVKKLLESAELQQTLATHIDQDGQNINLDKILQKINSVLTSNINLSKDDRLILIIIVFLNVSLNDPQKQKLLNRLDDTQQQQLQKILELANIDLQQSKSLSMRPNFIKQDAKKKYMQSDQILNRYISMIETVLQQSINGNSFKVNRKIFNYQFECLEINNQNQLQKNPNQQQFSLRNKGIIDKVVGNQKDTNSQKILIFMVGGMSIQEIRQLRKIEEKSNFQLIIGATGFYSSEQFLASL